MSFLGAHGLDRVAPGGGLAEQVLDLNDLLLQVADLALDVGRLAVGELPLGLLRRRRLRNGGRSGLRGLGLGLLGALLLVLDEVLVGLVIPLDDAGPAVGDL